MSQSPEMLYKYTF